MIIATSAILSILQGKPERRSLVEAIEAAESRRMSVATFVEISTTIETRYGAEGLRDFDRFIGRAGVELVPVDREQALLARDAFSRFGKGRYRTELTYGDYFAYALAISLGEQLLRSGNGFAQTEVLIG
jgi:ribonuclease VapC